MAKHFGIDLRALAGTRILAGVILLYDLWRRWGSLEAFLSDQGILKASLARGGYPVGWATFILPWPPSVHCLDGSATFQTSLLILHGLAATALLLGWKTRVAAIVCWYLTLSLHFRNELILNGGDFYLRTFLFWGMFLPWGERYSLDAKNSEPDEASKPVVIANLATVGLYMQVCLLYWGAAMHKSDEAWTVDYTALYYVLHIDAFVTPFGIWLRNWPEFLKLCTGLTYWAEWIVPVLLILGVKKLRAAGVVALVSLHLGIGLSMQVGLFWVIPLLCLMALWPVDLRESAAQEVRALHPVTSFLLGTILLALPYLNITSLDRERFPTPLAVYVAARSLGLHYGWNMFAHPKENKNGWYIFEATLEDGKQVDLLTAAPVSWKKPGTWEFYPDQHWRRYIVDLYRPEYEDRVKELAYYLTRRWEADNKSRVLSITVHFMEQETQLPYRPSETLDRPFLHLDLKESEE